jgi:dihydrolipoamide dehydrogenase
MDPTKTELVVVGAGPGGYAAAFYAADLGKKVILVEQDKRPGGVCLNRGREGIESSRHQLRRTLG